MNDFFRFPHTPHLAWLAQGTPRDDKVMSLAEARDFLAPEVVIEEKLDGANLGFSVSAEGVLRAQNRGQYLNTPHAGQFARLGDWLAAKEGDLFDALGEHLIAFGEWCAAKHSYDYNALPDWWMLFDVYDRQTGRFWSTRRRNAWASALGLTTVPCLLRGHTNLNHLKNLLTAQSSHYRCGPLEGVVLRVEDQDWLLERAKLVRADFVQQIDTHWRSRTMVWNKIQADGHGVSTSS